MYTNLGSAKVFLYGPKAKVSNFGAINNMYTSSHLGNGSSPSSAWSSRSDSTLRTTLRSRLESELQARTPTVTVVQEYCIFPDGAMLYPQTVYGSAGFAPGGSGGRQLQENTPLVISGKVGNNIRRVTYQNSNYFTSASPLECLNQSTAQTNLNALAADAVSLWSAQNLAKYTTAQLYSLLNNENQFNSIVNQVVSSFLKPLVNRSLTASTMTGAQAQDYFRRFRFNV